MPQSRRAPATPLGPLPLGPLVLVLAAAACGNVAQAAADGATDDPASAEVMATPSGRDASQDTVVVNVGDPYLTSDFETTYLGMAELPLGNGNVYTEGTCVTLLFEATYLATPGGRAVFRPSVRGYLDDGRVAENDDTGVGCGVSGVRELGYESGPRRNFEKGETARLFVGAIHIPAADAGKLQYVTLYGDEHTRMAVEIVHAP